MIKITQHISKLLFDHNCVIVPGFGGFVANYQSAKIHPTSFIFNSPSKQIAFNVKLTNNDGLLVNAVAQGEEISHYEAEKLVSAFVGEVNAALNDHKPVKLAGIGRLIMDVEHNIQFLADNAQNFSRQSYGLHSFTAAPVIRENAITVDLPVAETVKEKPKKQKKSSDALLPIAAVLLLTMLTMQIFIQSSMNGFNYSEIFGMNKIFSKNNYVLNKYKPTKFEINPSVTYFRKTDTASIVINAILVTTPEETIETPELAVAPITSSYFISAGSFYSVAEAESMIAKLKTKGYNGYVKDWGKYKIAAVNVPDDISTSSFREIFIENTGVDDAWVARNK